MGHRAERLANQVKDELGMIFLTRYSGSGLGMITITGVKMSADLRLAKVYFSVVERSERESVLAKLTADTPGIRHELAGKIRVRYMPELRFYIDDTADRVEKIENLLKEIHKNDNSASNELQ